MAPETQTPSPAEGPHTLAEVLTELANDPTTFDGSHDIREAARKANANLADVYSEITALREQIEELKQSETEEAQEGLLDANKRLLAAYVVRAAIQMPNGRSRPD